LGAGAVPPELDPLPPELEPLLEEPAVPLLDPDDEDVVPELPPWLPDEDEVAVPPELPLVALPLPDPVAPPEPLLDDVVELACQWPPVGRLVLSPHASASTEAGRRSARRRRPGRTGCR
jgi:hypothetical protein